MRTTLLAASLLAALPATFAAVPTRDVSSLKQLSLDDLLDIEVTSVSKRPEKLSETASAIQVVTGENIRRSTATNLPEALRLAPNLQLAQLNSYAWVVGARGFNGNFANKLLVMIDGRSVYTPLFAGVNWDAQNVLLEDLDRIEVVSGPGGTLWGANAVNGVINIISKSARETQGLYVMGSAGSYLENSQAVRYGGSIGGNLSYRVYAQRFERGSTKLSNGLDAADAWNMTHGGFRMDYTPSESDALIWQGDAFDGTEDTSPSDSSLRGRNLLGRWTRTFSADSDFSLQVYYDHISQRDVPSTITNRLNTFDFDLNHRFALSDRHQIIWGVGYRHMRSEVETSTPIAGLVPPNRTMPLYSGFLQDEILLVPDRWRLILGSKFEHNDFSGYEVQPSARLAWTPTETQTVWTAVSRAVRTPSRLDTDYHIPKTPPYFIAGGPEFESENVIAYELGYRVQPTPSSAVSLALFSNQYDDLYNLQTSSVPFTTENGIDGEAWGVELSATYQPTDFWRLRGGYIHFEKTLAPKPGHAATAAVIESLGHDPRDQLSLQSNWQLGSAVELDLTARYVAELPSPLVPAYLTFDVRLAWQRGNWELAAAGQNLGDDHHPEFATYQEIPRSFHGKLTWRY